MKYIKYALLLLFTICFIAITPLKSIYRTNVSTNNPGDEMPIPTVAYGYQISQQILPANNYIEKIELCIKSLNCNTDQGTLNIRLLDSEMNPVYTNEIPLSELPAYGWFDAIQDVTVVKGNTYYITVETINATDDGPIISYYRSGTAASTEEEGQALTYAMLPLDDCTLKLRITYHEYLSRLEYVTYYVFILFLIAFAYGKFKGRKSNRNI